MNDAPHPRILVAGIGNIFLGDDGFGCEVIRALSKMTMPAGVKAVDYGIRSFDLAYALLEPYQTVIFVDAVSRGGAPGTVYLLQPVQTDDEALSLDPHSISPVHLLAMARSFGKITAGILIVGCEPQDFGDECEGRLGLSDTVAASVSKAAEVVLEAIAQANRPETHQACTLNAVS